MKKRLKNKLEKRAGCMHYSDARMELLIRAIKRSHPNVGLIVFTTSKRGTIMDIKTYCDIVPTSVSVGGGSSNE